MNNDKLKLGDHVKLFLTNYYGIISNVNKHQSSYIGNVYEVIFSNVLTCDLTLSDDKLLESTKYSKLLCTCDQLVLVNNDHTDITKYN